MGTIDIDIDATVDSQNHKLKFSWEGDDNAIHNVINEIERVAARAASITPKRFTHEMLQTLRHLENETAVRSVHIEMG